MTFGQTLIDFRERYGVGRKRLHELTGISLSYLHYIENDRVLPGHENLEKIAKGISDHTGKQVSAKPLIRERDRIELSRLGFDRNKADLTLFLKESGPVDDEARGKIEAAIGRVLGGEHQTKRQRGK